MIYYLIINEDINMELVDQIAKQMPSSRYKKYLTYQKYEDKINCVFAYLLIKKYLIENNDDGAINIDYTPLEKPFFKNKKLQFNISHGNKMIAVAFSEATIGLDVEKITNFQNLLTSMYSKEEIKKYQDKLRIDEFNTKTWTAKESYTKLLGEGINIDFKTLVFDLEKNTIKYNGVYITSYQIEDYYLSISSSTTNIQIKEIKINDLLNM